MANEEKIKATRCGWTVDAQANLIVSVGRDSDVLAEQVKSGVAECWHFESEEVDIWAVVRREGNELVVCCLEGIGSQKIVPLIEQSAKRAGCKSIRAHIKRKGLTRMFPDWKLEEYIHKKVL